MGPGPDVSSPPKYVPTEMRTRKDSSQVKKWEDGKVYHGEFLGEKRHGRGTISYPDGSQYDGEWVDDLRHGQGAYRLSSPPVLGCILSPAPSGPAPSGTVSLPFALPWASLPPAEMTCAGGALNALGESATRANSTIGWLAVGSDAGAELSRALRERNGRVTGEKWSRQRARRDPPPLVGTPTGRTTTGTGWRETATGWECVSTLTGTSTRGSGLITCRTGQAVAGQGQPHLDSPVAPSRKLTPAN